MTETAKHFIILFSGIFLAIYGGYICMASIKNKKKFIDSYKRVDLIKIFGDTGRILYVISGLIVFVTGIMIFIRQIQHLTGD